MSYLIGILLVAVLWYFGSKASKKRAGERQAKLPALAPIVNGIADANSVSGTYADRPVRAGVYERKQGVGDDAYYEIFWSTSMQMASNSPDWALMLKGNMLGLGQKSLKIDCKDENRRARLEAVGLLGAAGQIPDLAQGTGELRYSNGWLTLMVRIKDDAAVPDPNQFRTYLEMVKYLVPFCEQG